MIWRNLSILNKKYIVFSRCILSIFIISFCFLSSCVDYMPITLYEQSTLYPDIYYALVKTAIDLHNKIDVNGDRMINCIDAAVLFYKYYPDKRKVHIVLNRNYANDMNHLFNYVLVDSIWMAVEPQAHYANNNSIWMHYIWGLKYNSSKDKIVTKNYIIYIR